MEVVDSGNKNVEIAVLRRNEPIRFLEEAEIGWWFLFLLLPI